ncbi:MAG: PKD domain-containing protein [Acidobacteriota bacterium]
MKSTPMHSDSLRPIPQALARLADSDLLRSWRAGSLIALLLLAGLFTAAPSFGGGSEFNCETTSFFTRNRATTVIVGVGSNNDDGVQIAAQLFETPEPITLRGFSFYGAMPMGGNPVDVTASVYLPDADGFPTGSPLASTTVTVDDVFMTLADVLQQAVFDEPVQVSEPYLLVLENDSADTYLLGFNDFQVNDGQGEGLSRMFFNNLWRNGLDVTFGGLPFDADFILLPDYSVDLEVELSTVDACLDGPGSLEFQASGSPILTNRFYNFGFDQPFQWTFGDGSPLGSGETVTHDYASVGPWEAVLFGVLSAGDGTGCIVEDGGFVGRVPRNLGLDFTEDFNALSVQYTATATGADAWSWDFGDGGSSTEQNPNHTYGSLGLFTACVTASNLCGETEAPGVCADVLSPFADLALGLGSNASLIDPGSTVTYTVTVMNTSGVQSGAQTVSHTVPSNLTGATWTCVVTGVGSCTNAGTGSIDETILLDPGSSLVYTVEGVFDPVGLESLTLAAEASIPTGDATADNSAELVLLSSAAVIFTDGFESGSTDAWSGLVQIDP